MAEEGLEYILAAKDEISPPAKAATTSLKGVTSALKEQNAALKEHGSSMDILGRQAEEAGGSFGGLRETISEFAGELGPAVAAVAGFSSMLEGVKFAIEASEFKENMTDVYTIVRGTAEEGERTFAELDKTARNIHMPAEKAHELASSLMLEGLTSQKAVTESVKAIGNLQSVGLGAGAAKLQTLIGRAAAQGGLKLSAKQLIGTGVSIDSLTADLAARLGKTRATIKAELDAGTIDTETGIEAITSEINRGKVGALATKKFAISDALTDMKNKIRGVFQEADSGPITEAFQRMSESFDLSTESGQGVKDTLDNLISTGAALIDFTGQLTGGVMSTLKGIGAAAKAAWDLAGSALDKVKAGVEWVDKHLGGGAYAAAGRHDQDVAVDKLVRGKIEQAKLDLFANAAKPGASKETIEQARKLGADIVDGATGGLIGKGDRPADAMNVIMLDSVDAAKKALKAHSPSMVMFELGADATEGFALGADRGADRSRDALSSATMAPAAQGGGGKGGERSINLTVSFGDIHGVAHSEDMRQIVEHAMADALERVQLELGG